MLEQLHADFPDDVRLVFRHFPLPSHPNSLLAIQAVEAAGLQGKYYEFSDYLFEKQGEWSPLDLTAFEAWLVDQTGEFGLNRDQFAADLKSEALVQKALEYQKTAMAASVGYTPFVLLNGRTYQNVIDTSNISNLRFLVRLISASKDQYTDCPPVVIETGKQYNATIETELGNIVFTIAADKVPVSANAASWLIQQGWYDNTSFYFVQRGNEAELEYAITGDHTQTGAGTPGFVVTTETSADLKFDKPGMVGFLNGSQLFFTYGAVPDLDGNYTILGEVVEGQDILDQLIVTTTDATGNLIPGTKIIKVTLSAK